MLETDIEYLVSLGFSVTFQLVGDDYYVRIDKDDELICVTAESTVELALVEALNFVEDELERQDA